MNEKAFTLVELLAVLVILSIIVLISTPIVINVVSGTKSELSREQIMIIENSARMWGVKNLSVDESGNPSRQYVTISELKDSGFIEDKELKNIESNSNSGVCITYDNQFIYEYKEYVSDCNS